MLEEGYGKEAIKEHDSQPPSIMNQIQQSGMYVTASHRKKSQLPETIKTEHVHGCMIQIQ
jgi:hypothetical protein